MNNGLKTRTMIVISDMILAWWLIFKCMAESDYKRYVLWMLDILLMNAQSIFVRLDLVQIC